MRHLVFALLACALAVPATARATPLSDAVEDYATFESDVSALMDAEITTPEQMNEALERAARHDPARLASGWIAYGALTAAQSPAFVAGVRARVRAAGRAAVLRQFLRDATYARRRPAGGREAIGLVLNTLTTDAARLDAAARRYEVFGDSERGAAWNASEGDRETRNEHLRALAAERAPVAPELAAHLHMQALAGSPLTDPDTMGGRRFWDAIAARPSPTLPAETLEVRNDRAAALNQMLTIAGLIAIDAIDANTARVTTLLDNRPVRDCLSFQQLEFRQCVSVAHDASEDGYCLARHGLDAPRACLAIAE